jgi:hypothetical protein
MSLQIHNLNRNIMLYLLDILLSLYIARSAMLTRLKLPVKLVVQISSGAAWNLTHPYRPTRSNTSKPSGTRCRLLLL